jgi:hypothetical protein
MLGQELEHDETPITQSSIDSDFPDLETCSVSENRRSRDRSKTTTRTSESLLAVRDKLSPSHAGRIPPTSLSTVECRGCLRWQDQTWPFILNLLESKATLARKIGVCPSLRVCTKYVLSICTGFLHAPPRLAGSSK